jgi:hypothetical protein
MATKYEVKIFVQTTEIYIVTADSECAALDAAKERFENGEKADVPYGDARVVDTDIEEMEE